MRSNDRDLLYYLELGMLQRLGNRYPDSQKTWTAANMRMQGRDSLARSANLVRGGSSYLLSDKLRTYDGYDYEKVMLLTYIALNHLALGDYENARVAIKQTHELEAVIAEQRAKQLAEVQDEAKKRGARTSFKELNGYPVQSIDNPEVNALMNSYQSALSHYLAGFVYEALGELSLAAPGYRLANELHPACRCSRTRSPAWKNACTHLTTARWMCSSSSPPVRRRRSTRSSSTCRCCQVTGGCWCRFRFR
jgi:hypothetical protein